MRRRPSSHGPRADGDPGYERPARLRGHGSSGGEVSIPGDLSLVGFDDVPEAARANPLLPTVHQPHIEKGLKAGRLLISRLRGEGPARPEILPTRLVVRGSTAPPKEYP